jgi:hypothetical protein
LSNCIIKAQFLKNLFLAKSTDFARAKRMNEAEFLVGLRSNLLLLQLQVDSQEHDRVSLARAGAQLYLHKPSDLELRSSLITQFPLHALSVSYHRDIIILYVLCTF